jgi:hypothetical protein
MSRKDGRPRSIVARTSLERCAFPGRGTPRHAVRRSTRARRGLDPVCHGSRGCSGCGAGISECAKTRTKMASSDCLRGCLLVAGRRRLMRVTVIAWCGLLTVAVWLPCPNAHGQGLQNQQAYWHQYNTVRQAANHAAERSLARSRFAGQRAAKRVPREPRRWRPARLLR